MAAALPYGPPLTSSELMLRGGLVLLFFGLLILESVLLWRAWSLWA